MKKKLTKKIKKKRVIVLTIIFVISAIIGLSAMGKYIISPIPFEMHVDHPNSVCLNVDSKNHATQDSPAALVDSLGGRVTIFDGDKKVHAQTGFNGKNSGMNSAESVYMFNKQLYVVGYETTIDFSQVYKTRIDRYSFDGDYLDTPYTMEAKDGVYTRVTCMFMYDDKLMLVTSSGKNVYLQQIEQQPDNSYKTNTYFTTSLNCALIDSFYLPDENKLLLVDDFGNPHNINLEAGLEKASIKPIDYVLQSDAYVIQYEYGENYQKYLTITDKINNTKEKVVLSHSPLYYDGNHVCYVDIGDNSICVYDIYQGKVDRYSQFPYEFGMYIYSLAFYISCIVMVIIVVSLVVMWIYRAWKFHHDKFLNFLIASSILITIVVCSTFISVHFYHKAVDDVANQNKSIAESISQTIFYNGESMDLNSYKDNMLPPAQQQKNIDALDDFNKRIVAIAKTFNDSNQNIYINLCSYNKNGENGYNIDVLGTPSYIEYTKQQNFGDQKQQLLEGKSISGAAESEVGNFVFTISPVYNTAGKIVGSIEVKSSLYVIWSEYISHFTSALITLILGAIVLYLLIKVIKNFKQSLNRFRIAVKEKRKHAEVNFCASIEFFRNLIFSCDAVLCVLISKSMLSEIGQGDNGVLIGLPMSLTAAGCMLSFFVFIGFFYRRSMKLIFTTSSLGLTCALIFCAFTVFWNNFFAYCIAKTLIGIFAGIIYISDMNLPMCLDDEEERAAVIRNIVITDISSPILGVFISGLVSQYFGSSAIYLFGAFGGAVIILISLFLMPAKSYFRETTSRKKTSMKKLLKYFFSPSIIALLLVCFMSICVSGYKSYLFPLYTDSLHMTAFEISNYCTLLTAASLIVCRWIDTFEQSSDHWTRALVALVFLGIVFSMFVVNTSLLLAMVAFFLSSVLTKILGSEWKLLAPRRCKEMGIDSAVVQPVFSAIEFIGCVIRPLMLGVFLAFGPGGACVALGVALFATAAIFYLFSHKTSLRKTPHLKTSTL